MYAIQFPDASPMNADIIEACNRLSAFCAVCRINPPRIVFDSTEFIEHLPSLATLNGSPIRIAGIELCLDHKASRNPADTFIDQEIGVV